MRLKGNHPSPWMQFYSVFSQTEIHTLMQSLLPIPCAHVARGDCRHSSSFSCVSITTPQHQRACMCVCVLLLVLCVQRRANNAGVKLAGLQSALAVMGAPTPAIAAPPSAASPEVKALASKEEAAMVALSRCVWFLSFFLLSFMERLSLPMESFGLLLRGFCLQNREGVRCAHRLAAWAVSVVFMHNTRAPCAPQVSSLVAG